MRPWTVVWDARRLACRSTLAAYAAVGLALAGAGNAPAATDPDLAVDPSGNASFAWVRSDGTKNLIQERQRSANGTLSDGQFLSAFGQTAGAPQVAVAPNGTATFVWHRFNGSNFIIQTRSRAPDGALSAVQNLSPGGQSAFDPQVAVDSNGNASFVWHRFNGTDDIVQARRRLANGTLEATQNLSAAGGSASEVRVAVAPDGAASFAWLRFDGTNDFAQTRRRFANGTLGGVRTLSAAGENAESPQLAVDPNDNASFVWRRVVAGTNDIIQARRRLANGTLEATQNLSAANQRADSPQVAVDPNDNASFVWLRVDGTGAVQARRRLANGTLEATQGLSPAVTSGPPQVAVAPDGAASFAWLRLDGTDNIAKARRRFANGTFGGVQSLSAPGADARDVRVGVDQTDNATFAWERSGVIQTRRRAPTLGATVDLSN
jgi:hypothetical protein